MIHIAVSAVAMKFWKESDKYGQDLSEAAIKKAKGQAYFFRAMQLFDLVRVYGAVPVVNKVLMAADP